MRILNRAWNNISGNIYKTIFYRNKRSSNRKKIKISDFLSLAVLDKEISFSFLNMEGLINSFFIVLKELFFGLIYVPSMLKGAYFGVIVAGKMIFYYGWQYVVAAIAYAAAYSAGSEWLVYNLNSSFYFVSLKVILLALCLPYFLSLFREKSYEKFHSLLQETMYHGNINDKIRNLYSFYAGIVYHGAISLFLGGIALESGLLVESKLYIFILLALILSLDLVSHENSNNAPLTVKKVVGGLALIYSILLGVPFLFRAFYNVYYYSTWFSLLGYIRVGWRIMILYIGMVFTFKD